MSLYVLSQNGQALANLDKANSVIIKHNSNSGNYDLMANYDYNYRICLASFSSEVEARDALACLIPEAMANTTPVVVTVDLNEAEPYRGFLVGEHTKTTRMLEPFREKDEYEE